MWIRKWNNAACPDGGDAHLVAANIIINVALGGPPLEGYFIFDFPICVYKFGEILGDVLIFPDRYLILI